MTAYLLVFFGAGAGGALRHGVNVSCARWCGPEFPWGTVSVNVLGSLVMGLLAGVFAARAGEAFTQQARLLLMTGVLGGFTTFSAYSLDAISLWERGSGGAAALYVLGSVVFSILAAAAGLSIARSFS